MVRRVDPGFTLGLLSKRRGETLEALRKSGLLERNKSLELSEVPLRVGLITSFDSAAYHDFVSTLEQSGYGFRVDFLHSAVQGREAESELAAALRRARSLEIDCLVMIRGGGSRTDLAVFDSYYACEYLGGKFPEYEFIADDATNKDIWTDDEYDVISAFDVLFHIVDDEKYIRLLRLISESLKHGGYFLFTESFGRTERRQFHYVSRNKPHYPFFCA